jgi:Uma2 family endonuclease
MSRQPHWHHQRICGNLYTELRAWCLTSGMGQASITPGVIFSDADNVVPDVVWISNERLAVLMDEAGHLTGPVARLFT